VFLVGQKLVSLVMLVFAALVAAVVNRFVMLVVPNLLSQPLPLHKKMSRPILTGH